MNTNLTIGIITFNSKAYIKPLIDSILRSSILPDKIIIFDNNSHDETLKLISEYNSSLIDIIKSKKNVGHSMACNELIKNCKTRYLILQDHDTELQKETLKILLDSALDFDDNEIAVSATIINAKHENKLCYGIDLHYMVSSLYRFSFQDKYIGNCPTTCVLIDLDKQPNTYFDNDFFIYINDIDFFYRLRINGYKILVNETAIVIHKEGSQNISGRKGAKYTPLKDYYITLNRLRFIMKNYQLKTLLLFIPAIMLTEIFGTINSFKQKTFNSHLRAYIHFIKNLKIIRNQRKRIQKERTIPDKKCITTANLQLSGSLMQNNLIKKVLIVYNILLNQYFKFIKLFL